MRTMTYTYLLIGVLTSLLLLSTAQAQDDYAQQNFVLLAILGPPMKDDPANIKTYQDAVSTLGAPLSAFDSSDGKMTYFFRHGRSVQIDKKTGRVTGTHGFGFPGAILARYAIFSGDGNTLTYFCPKGIEVDVNTESGQVTDIRGLWAADFVPTMEDIMSYRSTWFAKFREQDKIKAEIEDENKKALAAFRQEQYKRAVDLYKTRIMATVLHDIASATRQAGWNIASSVDLAGLNISSSIDRLRY